MRDLLLSHPVLFGMAWWAAFAAPRPLAAEPDPDGDPVAEAAAMREALAEGRAMPLPAMLELVRDRYAGDVVEIELEQAGAGFVYEIALLPPDGALREIELDAATGLPRGDAA